MKLSPLILAATLLCNAVLIGLALFRHPAPPAKTLRANAPTPASASTDTTDDKTLAQLFASDDNEALIQYLRENNIPPDIIRSIARARLDKQFAPRRAALEDPPRPYWHAWNKPSQSKPDPNRRAEKRALEDEYQAALKNLTAGLPAAERPPRERRVFGDLSDAKIAQIKAINKDYNDLRSLLREDMKGVTFPDDQSQLALFDKEQRSDLEKILTPGELRDYDLRSSPVASQVQKEIRYFNATEAEYTALYDAQAAVNDQTTGANLSAGELNRLREAAAQSVLTPERFEEYKIATTETYPAVRGLVTALKLPQTTIAQVITTQNETTAQADRIRNDTTLAPSDRDAQLAALAQNARQQLNTVLGEEGMNRYHDNQASAWLRQLTPKPPRQ